MTVPRTTGVYLFYQYSQERVVYVGSSVAIETRTRWHTRNLGRGTHYNPILQRTWDKYGADDFMAGILEETDRKNLMVREQYWLDRLVPLANIALYANNPTRGRKRPPMSEEQKRKLSIARMGKPLTEEHKKSISLAQSGKPHSEGWVRRQAEATRGRVCSDETRAKMSVSARQKPPVSDETREKQRIASTGRKHSEETKAKMRATWAIKRE